MDSLRKFFKKLKDRFVVMLFSNTGCGHNCCVKIEEEKDENK